MPSNGGTMAAYVPDVKSKLLSALPAAVYRRVEPSLERVSLEPKDLLYDGNAVIEHVYFPLSGVVSLVLEMKDRSIVEIATIGNEGMVGTPVFLGAERSPTRAVSQVPGPSLRMSVADFKEHIAAPDGILHDRIARYQQALINQISQSVACNHLRAIEERAARWLLMTHDRVSSDEFPLTQEFLSQMLGVRRPSVTIATGILETAGLITYKRGRITVLDREGLEGACCECYRTVKAEYDRLVAR
jgi:CRP-like cAMP-binding protein